MKTQLSILTPTIPGREKQLLELTEKIQKQIGDLPVEHLSLCDNRKRSIGAKRQSLVDIAQGKYIAFCDDDDDISDDYVEEILKAAPVDADVITFEQDSFYNEHYSKIVFGLNNQDEGYRPNGITLRAPWHVCAWKKSAVKTCQFGERNNGEDIIWSRQARRRVTTAFHIAKVLHIYRHDARLTAAPESGF